MTELSPRYESLAPLRIAGLAEAYSTKDMDRVGAQIPAQWQRLAPRLGRIPGQVGTVTYGVCFGMSRDGGFRYLSGVEIGDLEPLPDDLAHIELPAHDYAVFEHVGPVPEIRRTIDAAWRAWLPRSGREIADNFHLERYGEKFDPARGEGDIEIWLPIKG